MLELLVVVGVLAALAGLVWLVVHFARAAGESNARRKQAEANADESQRDAEAFQQPPAVGRALLDRLRRRMRNAGE